MALRKGTSEEDFVQTVLKDDLEEILVQLKSEIEGNPAATDQGRNTMASAEDANEDCVQLDTATLMMEKIEANVMEASIGKLDDPDGKLPRWLKYAETVVRERVTLIVEGSETALVTALAEAPVATYAATGNNSVIVLYDVKQAGESMSRPAFRPPSLRRAHVRKLVGAILQARSKRQAILENDVFVMMDAGKHGNENELLGSFLNDQGKLLPREKRTIYMNYLEQSIADRRERSRGNLDVMEFTHFVTSKVLCLEDRKHLHYTGSLRSNCLGPVALPDYDALWMLPFGHKKSLYGVAGRVPVGGPGDRASEPSNLEDIDEEIESWTTRAPNRTNATLEPVCYGAETVEFYEDLIDWHRAKAFINLTSTDINAALACIRTKVPYVGITWTDYHKDIFTTELVRQTFALLQDEKSPLYEAELVQLLGQKKKKPKAEAVTIEDTGGGKEAPKHSKAKKGNPKVVEVDTEGKAAAKKAKAKTKAKAKSKTQLLKELKAMQEEEEEEEDEDAEEDDDEEPKDSEDD